METRAVVNFQSLGRALSELLPHHNAIPRAIYSLRFARHRLQSAGAKLEEGFSLVLATLNRKEFLACAVTAVLANTEMPFELIIMDNASDDGTGEMCETLQAKHPGLVRHVRLKRNIGTNAYALGFLQAKYRYLVCMDDDILALSKGWDRATVDAFARFSRLGFLAMNVVQDKYTDGAKKEIGLYADSSVSDTTIEVGPTGAWFTVTTRQIYNEVGGFIFRPYKPFHLHDGKYIRKLTKKDYFAGILKKKFVYHANGPYWAAAYGYHKMWEVKYQRNYKHLLAQIDNVEIDEVRSPEYAKTMVIKAGQPYADGAA